MKKQVLAAVFAVIALLVLVAVAVPFWFGQKAEKTYGAMLDRLSGNSGVRLISNKYERGWLSSTAETVIQSPKLSLELIARHRIDHGPIPLGRILEGEWRYTPVTALIASQAFLSVPGKENAMEWPALTAETTFRLNGDGVVHIKMSPINKSGAQGQTFDWHGMSGDITFDREWKKIRVDLLAPALSLSAVATENNLTLSQLSLHSDMQEGSAGYFFGDVTLALGQLEISNANRGVGLRGLEIVTSAHPSGENVNLIFRYKLDEVRLAQERLGPGELVIEVRQLDAASLVKFKNEMDAIYRGNPPSSQAEMMVAGKTLALIGALAKNAPELEITRLSFKTREGEISGKAKFVLDGRRRNLGQSPAQILTALSGNLEVSIPEPVLKRMLIPVIRQDIEAFHRSGALSADELAQLSPDAMTEIVNRVFPRYLARNEFTRLLVEEGGRYKLNLSIRQGQVLINGQPWHVPTRIALAH